MTAERAHAIGAFLDAAGWGGALRSPLAGDASFRRYERLANDDATMVLMDAPPPQEDVRAFARVAERLIGLGLSAPNILARDEAAGLLLLEDFGDDTYTAVLGAGGDEAALYGSALDLLIALHQNYRDDGALPPYDDERLLEEAALLVDWYLPALRGDGTPGDVRAEYLELWRESFATARAMPSTLVLRDYHVDNLMWLPDRPGVAACGLLDFQDAVIGPVTYDLVSLLEDARRDVPADLARDLLGRYLAAFPELDGQAFAASYAVLGAQRSAKILGIFTRLDRRDGKPVYLEHIPRVWRWLEGGLAHPALARLEAWFAREVPPEDRRAPAPGVAA
ncbi:MAG: phosphotransferase [Alphaproteobacteria bacterium]|jgi:hypothetical protein|nr:phosphotransferase [Alphaproteobacteria bacterium]